MAQKWVPFSPKQKLAANQSRAFINAYDGPVRSGKTVSQRFAFYEFLKDPPHDELLVSGKTKDTIRRNVLDDLLDLFDLVGHDWDWNKSDGVVEVKFPLGMRTLHIVGANDEGSESRIRGGTFGGWLSDETTLAPKSFVQMALSRLSPPGSRAFWTMNADSPYHYIHEDYLTNVELLAKGILRRFEFSLRDNWSLSKRYVQNLKALYSGLWYKRFIEGVWAIAEGAVYALWDPAVHVIKGVLPKFAEVVVGIDYGTSNPFAAVALGRIKGTAKGWIAFNELRHEGRDAQAPMTTGGHSKMLGKWLGEIGVRNPTAIVVDPSAAAFKVQLKQDGFRKVYDANNDVLDGIQQVDQGLSSGALKIHGENCPMLVREFPSYVWDPKKQEKGEDVPLKKDARDHSLDALRYGVRKAFGRPALQIVDSPIASGGN